MITFVQNDWKPDYPQPAAAGQNYVSGGQHVAIPLNG